MVRGTGRITEEAIDRDYPHQVEITMPDSGFLMLQEVMEAFCHDIDFERRAIEHRPDHFARWCFKDKNVADDFQAMFGGARIDL